MTEIPFVKDFPFVYGEADALTSRVTRVIAKNPGPFTYTGSGTYIVGAGTDDAAVIDPGPYDLAHRDAVLAAAKGRISHILITHTHRDHCGGARTLADAAAAPIFGFGAHPRANGPMQDAKLDEGGDLDFAPDHQIGDGDTLQGDGWTLTALHTPGHIGNHLCFALEEENALFTGDHIMGWATTVVIPPSGHMGDYLDSLDRLLKREDAIYYPTHGAPIENPLRFTRAVRAHRRIRDGQILEQLKQGRSRIKDIVAVMYAEVDKRLHGAAAMTVLAHLIRLAETGAVATEGDATLEAEYRLPA